MEERVFPSTTFFRALRALFMTLLILSSITASFLTLFLLLAFFTLLDWDSWDERSDQDGAALRLAVAFLFLVSSLNVIQVYTGWIGLRRKEVMYLAAYAAFEFICLTMWFLVFLFHDQKSLPIFKMLTSFSSIAVTLTMIHQIFTAPDE